MAGARVSFAVGAILATVSTTTVALPQATRLGVELQINAYTTGVQRLPAVAVGGSGGFVVAWESYGQDGAAAGTFARRYDADGSPLADEFQVTSYTDGYQYRPTVAIDGDGDFVVAWQSFGQDYDSNGIFARRFDSSGAAQGEEFQVNSYTPGDQRLPAVAISAGGSFVVIWASFAQDQSSDGVFARLFDTGGAPQAVEFQVNSFTGLTQLYPTVAMDDDGEFVVAWQSFGQDGDHYGVFARRFDAAAAPQSTEFQVNAHTASVQAHPAAAMDADGDFVIAWHSFGADGNAHGVFARRFDDTGAPVGGELQVNVYTPGDQRFSTVAMDAGGAFVVSWSSFLEDGSSDGVFARLFTASGTPRGGAFQVSTFTVSTQLQAAVAADDAGDFVVAWQSFSQDGHDYGVFGQRFDPLATLDVDGNQATEPLTDGLLVLRFHFGFTGGALVNSALAADCTRCDPAAISAYLSGLGSTLDVDGDGGMPAPLTDGLLVLRFLFGFTGSALTGGAVDDDCSRCDAAMIAPYLQGLT